MYPCATLLDFQPPWRLSVRISAPTSASIVAEVRRKVWLVYFSGSRRFKSCGTSFGIAPKDLLPITWCVHLPLRVPKKKSIRVHILRSQNFVLPDKIVEVSAYYKLSRDIVLGTRDCYYDHFVTMFNVFHRYVLQLFSSASPSNSKYQCDLK